MGVVEQAKGKVKQAIGDLTDNDALRLEGEAQDDKGDEQRQETEARAKAKLHEEKADLADARLEE
jgi:uncharacterized protein YjbJ (UPF0337 family)